MFIPNYVFSLSTATPLAQFSLTPDGVVRFQTATGNFHESIPCLGELLKCCGIGVADILPVLEVRVLPHPFELYAGVTLIAVLRQGGGSRCVAVVGSELSTEQAAHLFQVFPDLVAIAHTQGNVLAPVKPPKPAYADAPYDWTPRRRAPRRPLLQVVDQDLD